MTTGNTHIYEGMFLFPTSSASDLQATSQWIHDLLGRVDAEILSFAKWDERRLAYDIRGNRRGIYFLTYFRADPTHLRELERVCNLDETLLRYMFLRADHVTDEVIEASDGRAQLQDEIALRGEQEETSPAATATVTTAAEKAEREAKAEAEKPRAAEAEPVAEPAAEGESAAEPTEEPSS